MNKKVLIIVNIALLVVAAVLVCLILGVGGKSDAALWQEQYDLGVRYYSEGNYEAAVLAFQAAINIDSARPDAYRGAAQAYIALGDEESAAQILEQGYANTGDETMKEWTEWYEQEQAQDREPARGTVTVTDAYADQVSGEYYGEYSCCYHIPQIQVDGNSDFPVNGKLYQELFGILTEGVYANQGQPDYAPDIQKLHYGWGQKGDIVTVLVATDYYHYPWPQYYIYTMDVSTGAEASQADILAVFGLTESEFYEKAEAALAIYMDNRIREMAGNPSDLLEDIRNRTLEQENIRSSRPYIDENGNLCIAVMTWVPAGAGNYYTLIDLNTATDAKEPECTGHGQEAGDIGLYADVLEEAIVETNRAVDSFDGHGALYDVDGNGTEELILMYFRKVYYDRAEREYEHSYCSVYTIENGTVVPLLDKELVALVGGPKSHISIVEKDGKNYLATTWDTGGADDRYGEWVLYTVAGSEIITETTITYEMKYSENWQEVQYGSSHAIFDGERKSYRDLENWIASYCEVVLLEDIYYSDEVAPMTLEELLDMVRG